MNYTILKYNKGIYVKIYKLNVVTDNPNILINGRIIKKRSKVINIYDKMLKMSHTLINIHISKFRVKNKNYSLNKILLFSLNHYMKIRSKLEEEEINKQNKVVELPIKSKINSKFSLFWKIVCGMLIILLLVFISDYNSIKTKINQSNLLRLDSIKSEYEQNKCEENGNREALKAFCSSLRSEIEIIKTKSPTTISIFFIWFLDIFSSAYQALGYSSFALTFLIIFLFIKFA